MNIVGISGSITDPSRTTVLTRELLDLLSDASPVEKSTLVSIAALAGTLGTTLDPSQLPPLLANTYAALAAADVVVVATPVYKGSYTGLLKHFLDLLDPQALKGKIVILAAVGGSERHALVVEHQLRPLLGFFGTHAVPASLYLRDSDFVRDAESAEGYRLANEEVHARLRLVASQARALSALRQEAEAA